MLLFTYLVWEFVFLEHKRSVSAFSARTLNLEVEFLLLMVFDTS